jgi:hypothetical protein
VRRERDSRARASYAGADERLSDACRTLQRFARYLGLEAGALAKARTGGRVASHDLVRVADRAGGVLRVTEWRLEAGPDVASLAVSAPRLQLNDQAGELIVLSEGRPDDAVLRRLSRLPRCHRRRDNAERADGRDRGEQGA